jgi:hypothetical protein
LLPFSERPKANLFVLNLLVYSICITNKKPYNVETTRGRSVVQISRIV